MKRAGYDVQWRRPSLKPERKTADEAQRKDICDKLRMKPQSFWTGVLDACIDCKRWQIPRNVRGWQHLRKTRVRGHLRTRKEGLDKGYTKPDKRKHHQNVGPHVNVCAAIIGGRVRVWHYLPGRWNGAAAAALYKDVIAKALKRYRGEKRRYSLLEDNDPTGFKSKVGISTKASLNIQPLAFPTYSPDLNPCDFALWEEVENRMAKQEYPVGETVDSFKARLRRTALAIPEHVVRKMLGAMKHRTKAVYERDGGNIPRD